MSGELAAERWSPAQRVESVLISILSLLEDPEVNSPANVDAGVMLRTRPEDYKKRVKQDVDSSKRDIPTGFVIPSTAETKPPPKIEEDGDFWLDSDADDASFGGSESFAEDEDDDFEDADMTEAEDETEKKP
jgi:ubiquitin-conjugating enzyme E2 R